MAGKKSLMGMTSAQQVSPDRLNVDIRPLGTRVFAWLSSPSNMTVLFFMMTGLCFFYPMFADYMLFVACILSLYAFSRKEAVPLKMPKQSKLPDPKDPNPGTGAPGPADGIFFLGNDMDSGKELWITNSDARQHFLVLGTTGAGKAASVNSHVHTPSGWRRLGDLAVGDTVSCPVDGGASAVTGVFPQGVRSMWQVAFADGRFVRVDAEHLWEVRRRMPGAPAGAPVVMTTRELAAHLSTDPSSAFSVPLCAPMEKPKAALDPAPARMARMLLDGSISGGIPRAYIEASLAQRLALADALVGEADRGGQVLFRSADAALVRDLREILHSLGGSTRIVEAPNGQTELHDAADGTGDLQVSSILPDQGEEEAVCIMVDHPRHLYVMDDYVVTHNTENLIGFAANALTWGSGLLFCDGKGDVSLFAKMFAMTRRFGREDDLLVLNFMTGGRDLEGGNGQVLSHTINPFATGASDYLTQMVVSLMDDAGGDGAMWKGRATAMLSGVIKALVFLRDRGHIDLNVGVIRDHMQLKRIIALCDPAQYPDMSAEIREMIRSYLTSLPGYQEDKKEKQAQTTLDQHGYLEMQFTKIFSSLASVYKHIFFTPYGQVDMMDVVLNRRILVIMLPALEKSGDELENLGKIVVANLKGMMGATLGSSLEGTWQKVVDNRATNSPSPFLCILDEVGYYTVDGLALMAAQARSLGFSMVYASQDIPAMKRRNEKEAASIIANTNTKIFMRTEEAKETGALAVEAADKGTRVRIGGFERRIGDVAGSSYGMGEGTNYEDVNRVSYSDLKGQGAGEMHVLFQNELVRAKAFYADPASSLDMHKLRLRANHFIEIRRPDPAAIEIANQIPEVVRRLIDPTNREMLVAEAERAVKEMDDAFVASDDLAIVATVMGRMIERKRPPLEAACAGVGDVINRLRNATTSFAGQARAVRGPADAFPSFPATIPGGPGDISEEDLDDENLPGERISAPVAPPPRPQAAPPRRPAPRVDRSVPHEVEVEGRRPDPVASKMSSNDALLRSLAALNFDDDMEPGLVEARLDDAMGSISGGETEKVSPERIAQVVNTFDRSAAAAGIDTADGDDSGGGAAGETMFVTDFLEALLDDKEGGGAL